ncbi:MAG: DUF5995 family protein [Gemmatimonadetes bacterium]|nr:DUF5995 family protein [Gemmatimonadota bacterium]
MLTIPAPFRTPADVRAGLGALEQHFLRTRDRRGVFLTAYRTITEAVEAQIAAQGFRDSAWVSRYLVAFGTLYRDALAADAAGDRAKVPKAWRIAFDAARAGRGWVIQHLILGVNAHINHDLALALLVAGIDTDRATRYADHTAVNAVLERATPALKAQVSALWAPLLTRLDAAAGTLDDDVTTFSIPKARDHAWAMAVALDATRGRPTEALLRTALDEQAAVVAQLTLTPPVHAPVIDRSKRLLERIDHVLRIGSRLRDV